MSIVEIEEASDPRLDGYRGLRDQDLSRYDGTGHGLLVAEGTFVLRRLVASGRTVRSVLLSPARARGLTAELGGLDIPIYVAPEHLVQEVSGFRFHRGALALAERWPLPDAATLAAGARLALVLEGVADQENLGSVFRSAAALGADAVLLCPRCADPLYRRSVRVSMGHVLTLPFSRFSTWPEPLAAMRSAGTAVVALSTSPDGVPVGDLALGAAGRVALLVGSEAEGLSAGALAEATVRARIAMVPGADSLNLAAAAAIALHRLGPLA
ncbi:MAG: TrmH family RNA methyltransferase [Acidimicrobiales bacterium]